MRSLTGLLVGYTILIAGNSLLTTLVSLRMLEAESSALDVGLVQSCYFVGFIVGAVALGPLVANLGSQRSFISFGAVAALAAAGYLFFGAPREWAALRLVTGFCMVGIFTSIESGVNGAVANGKRGRAFSLYLLLTFLGVSSGQMLLGVCPKAGDADRIVVNALFLCAIIPVALIGEWKQPAPKIAASSPRPTLSQRAAVLFDGLRVLLRAAPRSVPGAIGAGLLSSAFYALTPVYLARVDFPTSDISQVMAVAVIGGLLSQWPVGKLSDLVGRRAALGTVSLAAAFSSVLLVFVRTLGVVDVLLFFYVALTFTFYGVIASDANDRVDEAQRVSTSATLLLVFSIGGAFGPALASLFMKSLGAGGLYVFSLFVTLGLAALSFARNEPRARRTTFDR
ncbi:MFS family permease [Paraburkholderia youngii]|uniref:MFS transporter n=1 Tax=Paraburkholderia youngii TaxID=2782701 RepID=UPI003D1C9BB0